MAKTVSLVVPRGLRAAIEDEATRTRRTPEALVEAKLLRWAGLDHFGSARRSPVLPLGGPFAMAMPIKVRLRSDLLVRLARASETAGLGLTEGIALVVADGIEGGS
ncbi:MULTISPECIES: hypothetical protein [Alphaproteobacteria]|uniref:hypothetical protein n=1 Tax=Alphaproteobacteria TaxID=28211 RepID=UPI003266CD19